MSRHTHVLIKGSKRYEVVCGFDRPLHEYFIQVWDIENPSDDDTPVFSVASYNTMKPHPDTPEKVRYSNSEILSLMEEWGCSFDYRRAVAMDLPF